MATPELVAAMRAVADALRQRLDERKFELAIGGTSAHALDLMADDLGYLALRLELAAERIDSKR